MMRICFLAPINSAHIEKWCRFFVSRGHEVHIISFTRGSLPGTIVHFIDTGTEAESSDIKKLNYLLKVVAVRRLIREINPDIINAHYATSYGTVAALAGLKNYILSVWGSDIYEFPKKSILHKTLLKFSLSRAPHLFSTSRAMADEATKYTNKEFVITPFGVDTELFSPEKRDRIDTDFVVGTVKALAAQYGIDCLLRAAAIVRGEHREIPLKLRIAGKGPAETKLKMLSKELEIEELVTWLGFISQEQAAIEWANMDLAVIVSRKESFGVSAMEAQSCACPVIVSDVPGLMEATSPGTTSVVVPKDNDQVLANTIYMLYSDPERRRNMGKRGREFVVKTYDYHRCFEKIEKHFEKIILN